MYTEADQPSQKFIFQGFLFPNRFRIFRIIRHPSNYLPVIVGKIESTSIGSILFLRFKMLFEAKVYLLLTSLMAMLLVIFFSYIQEYLYAMLSFLCLAGNYTLVFLNFRREVRLSNKMLDSVLEKEAEIKDR
ncbi:MAG: hypothetical protein MI784_03775 [Cytophagales bacterium]|nr:hypothetical protein [Cytophagales bacterium]